MTDASQSKETIARKLIYLRKNHGKSQFQVAKKINIGRSRYQSFEDRRVIVPYAILKALCDLYKISLDEFESLKIIDKPLIRIK